MPRVSVNLGSSRPGGLDIALAGLVNQTFEDFEVVFVDGRYHQRHAQVLDYVKKSGLRQPFYHVPNHRVRADVWNASCAGYNTGFMLSAGEIVVMLLDYAYAPPTWLEEHVKHQVESKIVMAPHEYRTLVGAVTRVGEAVAFTRDRISAMSPDNAISLLVRSREYFDEITCFPKPFTADQLDNFHVEESDAKCQMATGPNAWDYFNTKNESFPLQAVLDINGMDENYDRGRGPGDPDLGFRLALAGLQPWVVREAMVHCLNPRGILPNLNIVIPENGRLPPPHHNRWFIEDGYRYFEIVKAHRHPRAPNPFEIRDKRQELWYWRELSLAPEPLIPQNTVSDEDYY